MRIILIVAWLMVALNTARDLAVHDFGLWFWVNAAVAVSVPVVAIARSREYRS